MYRKIGGADGALRGGGCGVDSCAPYGTLLEAPQVKAWGAATLFFGVGRVSDCEERIDAGMEHPSSEVL